MAERPRIEIRGRIGEGAAAEVYDGRLIYSTGVVRRVAIKRLRSGERRDVEGFADECRILRFLGHAGIVGVLDYGLLDGRPMIVMERVDGPNLGRLRDLAVAASVEVPPEVALHVAAEIAHALAHAHTARDDHGRPLGLVHRDVTPPNILVSWSGDVKLTDFGIAWAFRRVTATEVGHTKGKLGFMPPEQLEARDVDPRTDVFALACVLHYFLTGTSPVGKQDADEPFERAIDPSLPDDIRDIIERSTRTRPDDRYATASAMAEDIDRALGPRLQVGPRSRLLEWMGLLAEPETLFDRPEPSTVEVIAVDTDHDLLEFETVAARPGDVVDVRPTVPVPVKEEAPASPAPTKSRIALAATVAVAFALGIGVGRVSNESAPAPAAERAAIDRSEAKRAVDALSAALAAGSAKLSPETQVEMETELLELRLAAAKANDAEDLRAVVERANRARRAIAP